MPSADHIDINDLNNFANNEDAGGEWLAHPENTIWAIVEDNGKRLAEQKDLVRLSGSERYTDRFTQWLWGPFLQFFHRIYSKFRVRKRPPHFLPGKANNPLGCRFGRWKL